MNQHLHPRSSRSDSLTVICAWCRETLFRGGPTVSHGLCEPCADNFSQSINGPRSRTTAAS